jgi:ribosomal protein S18 acetylase RimI-like enzyme
MQAADNRQNPSNFSKRRPNRRAECFCHPTATPNVAAWITVAWRIRSTIRARQIAFLESQFELQRHHYRTHFQNAEFSVLEQNGVPAGRLYIHRQADVVHVVDISLLPEWRGHGAGTALMRAVCAEAQAAGKKASVAVEKFNPAQRLYRRLGFREVADIGAYWTMEWSAAPGRDAPAIS